MNEQLKKRVYEKAAQRGITLDSVYEERINYELEQFARYAHPEDPTNSGFETNILLYSKTIDVCRSLHIPVLHNKLQCGASLIFYLLGISSVDPVEHHITFLELDDYTLFFLKVPHGTMDVIATAMSKETDFIISRMVKKFERGEEIDSKYYFRTIMGYNGSEYLRKKECSFRKNADKVLFTSEGEYYEDEFANDSWEKDLCFWICFEEVPLLTLLHNLNKQKPDVKATLYNDENVFAFLKHERPEDILDSLKVKMFNNKNEYVPTLAWLEKLPLSNIRDLSAAIALSNVKNSDFIYDYIELYNRFYKLGKPDMFDSDKRIQSIFARGNGSLLYHEQIIDLMMLVLKFNHDEAWRFRNTRMDEYKEDKSTPIEIIDQLKKGVKTNTTLAPSSHQALWMAILDSIPYATKEVDAIYEAQTLYQLAHYNHYSSDIFEKCYDETMAKAVV